MLRKKYDFTSERELLKFSYEQHCEHFELALAYAHDQANHRQWEAVSSALDPFALEGVKRERIEHFCHLLGMAKLMMGDEDEAERLWRRGQAAKPSDGEGPEEGSTCGLEDYVALIDATRSRRYNGDDRRPADPAWGDRSLLSRLVSATLRADELMGRADVEGAIEAIDVGVVWSTGELQSVARLAEVHLRATAGTASERFHKAQALAAFLDHHQDRHCRTIPIPGARWTAEELEDLAGRCRAWLDKELTA